MQDLLLLIVSSPSGAGKTTLTRKLLESFPDVTFSVSHTTRPPRTGEVDGQDYHFVDRERFEGMVSDGQFIEWAKVHDNFYGTCLSEMEQAKSDGKIGIVFDVDYQGARQIKGRMPGAIGVFILPPSITELRHRLDARATDTPEVIKRRFDKARLEIEHYLFFDYIIVNDQVEQAAARLRGIVYAELSRWERVAVHAEDLLRTGPP